MSAKLGIKEIGPALLEMVSDTKRPAEVRVATQSRARARAHLARLERASS